MFCRPIPVAKVVDFHVDGPSGDIPVRLSYPEGDVVAMVRPSGRCNLFGVIVSSADCTAGRARTTPGVLAWRLLVFEPSIHFARPLLPQTGYRRHVRCAGC